jgi:hypothetical protein
MEYQKYNFYLDTGLNCRNTIRSESWTHNWLK